jgi:hypothetical protein
MFTPGIAEGINLSKNEVGKVRFLNTVTDRLTVILTASLTTPSEERLLIVIAQPLTRSVEQELFMYNSRTRTMIIRVNNAKNNKVTMCISMSSRGKLIFLFRSSEPSYIDTSSNAHIANTHLLQM